jgi:hypothetical protein
MEVKKAGTAEEYKEHTLVTSSCNTSLLKFQAAGLPLQLSKF